jgi:hypothetical protein
VTSAEWATPAANGAARKMFLMVRFASPRNSRSCRALGSSWPSPVRAARQDCASASPPGGRARWLRAALLRL